MKEKKRDIVEVIDHLHEVRFLVVDCIERGVNVVDSRPKNRDLRNGARNKKKKHFWLYESS